MQYNIKYAHTNIIANDWKRLAKFYIEVFGCRPIYPERNLSGEWLDKLTLLEQVTIKGIHLYLPGYENGPTLEIFEYSPADKSNKQQLINSKGFGHIAFQVDDVEKILNKVIEHGGTRFTKIVNQEYPELKSFLTVTYVKDPEGNFIELQNWQ